MLKLHLKQNTTLKAVIRYFDLQSNRDMHTDGYRADTKASPAANDIVFASVIPQYVAVSAGVIAEPLLRHYIQSDAWQFDWAALIGRIVFGLIIGIILLPAVYKSAFDPRKPVLVQLAALFPMGVGWQSLFTSATKIGLG